MASRKELELRAAACNVNQANYPNDSKLEQAVIYAELHVTASSTATTLQPTANALTAGGGANV